MAAHKNGLAMETWAFSKSELAHPENCNGTDLLLTGPLPGVRDGFGILIQRNGIPTNRWADGTLGVPDNVRKQAQEEETLYHNLHSKDIEETMIWLEVEANKDGEFIRFIEEHKTPEAVVETLREKLRELQSGTYAERVIGDKLADSIIDVKGKEALDRLRKNVDGMKAALTSLEMVWQAACGE